MAVDLREAVSESLKQVDSSFCIKPKQFEAISNIVSGYDTLAILPTSFGKSLIFQLLPSVCKRRVTTVLEIPGNFSSVLDIPGNSWIFIRNY